MFCSFNLIKNSFFSKVFKNVEIKEKLLSSFILTFRGKWESIKIGVLRNFAKFTGKHLCQSLFLNKVAVLRPAALLKKRLWRRCFPVNFAKFLGTPFLQNQQKALEFFRKILH